MGEFGLTLTDICSAGVSLFLRTALCQMKMSSVKKAKVLSPDCLMLILDKFLSRVFALLFILSCLFSKHGIKIGIMNL
jgi:hypothetical protein